MKKLIYPSYYKTFRCTADQCPNTCCRGWNIEIDDEILERWNRLYTNTPRDFSGMPAKKKDGTEICSVHNTTEDCCLLDHMNVSPLGKSGLRRTIALDETMHCPILTENGLCSIVLRYGDEMIPKICREFPRQEIETDQMLQKSVAIRCPAVLDLLWQEDHFSYETEGTITQENYPAGVLLDGLLKASRDLDNQKDKKSEDLDNQKASRFEDSEIAVLSSQYLHGIFLSCLRTHQKLKASVPADQNGLREFGQEMLDGENMQLFFKNLETILTPRTDSKFLLPEQDSNYSNDIPGVISVPDTNFSFRKDSVPDMNSSFPEDSVPDLRICHDMMYEIMREFFENPVFGDDFKKLFYQSRELLSLPEEKQWQMFQEVNLSPDMEKKLLLIIEEELFHSIFTVEVQDYETILVRLQWLILQYLVIRYMIYLDYQNNKEVTDAQLNHRILNVFRVTDLPDIVKISFFDTSFKNWTWSEQAPEIELLKQVH